MKTTRLTIVLLIVTAALTVTSWKEPGSAMTLCVNPGGTGGCFSTIQAAVNAAMPGDTINVAAGTYNELVNVNKQVFLQGANSGVDACTGMRAAESIVAGNMGSSAFNVTANGAVVNGFTIQGNTIGNQFGSGIVTGANTSGVQVLNNIIQNNIVGILMGGDDSIIRGNKIQNNNNPGPASGHGIYTDQFVAGGTLSNVAIDNNCFAGHIGPTGTDGQAIGFSSTDAAKPATGIGITNNTFTGNGRAFYMFNVTSSVFVQNTSSGATFAGSADLRIFEGVNGLSIRENSLTGGVADAVRISNALTGSPNATNVTMTCNSITSYGGDGLEISAGGYTGTLLAENNWWGSATGPTIASNPGGTGETIVDPGTQVDYTPFLTSGTDANPGALGFQCACAPLPANMVSWWKADGNANDSTGGNNGTLQNGATFAAGEVGQAFSFDGVDDFVSVADNANLNTQTLTIDGWIRTSGAADPLAAFIATKSGTNGLSGYEFGVQPSTGRLRFTLNGGAGGADLFGTTNVQDNQFHFVAATYDGSTMSIYLDGQLEASTSVTTTITYAAGQPFLIGIRTGSPVGRWSGLIDELEFFNTALTQTQIQAIYTAGSTGKCVCAGITCPANITQSNDPAQCGAVVTYPAPTPGGGCGTITCSPASGSFFPKGTTTVNCTSSVGPTCSFTVTVNDTQPPTITCPANQTTCNDPNQCGAVVSYPPPTASDNCPGVTATCSPASGSFFPKGTTTVTCTATDASGNNAPCSFTVTVNDCQPPTITCPANQTAVTNQNVCLPPGQAPCQIVTFSPPTAGDNCPGVTVACIPPSGSCFPVGATTVTCTATDASGNTATCSFTVTTFDVCLQDNSNPATKLIFNSTTGEYRFCCGGTTYTGTGTIQKMGCIVTLTHNSPTRRVMGKADKTTFKGTASIQTPPGVTKCTLIDSDIRNNACICQ